MYLLIVLEAFLKKISILIALPICPYGNKLNYTNWSEYVYRKNQKRVVSNCFRGTRLQLGLFFFQQEAHICISKSY